MLPVSVENWTCDDVSEWLKESGFEHYCTLFCNEHKIDGRALLTFTEADLKQPPLKIKVLGDVKRLTLSIRQLQTANYSSLIRLGIISDTGFPLNTVGQFHASPSCNTVAGDVQAAVSEQNGHRYRQRKESMDSLASDQTPLCDSDSMACPVAHNLEPEIWKTVISVGYFFLVTWITAIVMVIVHDRVPDMEKYPPLPDIFLDNVPHIPWAFDMCEVTACILGLIWMTILVFHKHRFILLRRMFAIFGSVFLLRCVTMLITSLSVPGKHLDCKARVPSFFQPYGDMWAKLSQAFAIWRGAGMSIQGVRTCGDYMFSGHTVTLTMLNFFITEYTPRRLYYLHTFTWILNVFGIFFILAAHEHYSIDVFIAFYISTRLFLYYHTLANNRDLMQRDSKRTRIWFPLFSFFESRVGGIVPNEFENPFTLKRLLLLFTFSWLKRNISGHWHDQ